MTSLSFGRCIAGSVLAAFLAAGPTHLAAAQPRSATELGGISASGSYLAALIPENRPCRPTQTLAERLAQLVKRGERRVVVELDVRQHARSRRSG